MLLTRDGSTDQQENRWSNLLLIVVGSSVDRVCGVKEAEWSESRIKKGKLQVASVVGAFPR
jgi:hypothetical protein